MANLTREMKDISFNNSFGFRPRENMCCELCLFGTGEHATFCVGLPSCKHSDFRLPPHPCPMASEIHADERPCTCCDGCMHECAMDI